MGFAQRGKESAGIIPVFQQGHVTMPLLGREHRTGRAQDKNSQAGNEDETAGAVNTTPTPEK